ncbi:MAG: response regulator [Candidatus Zixiibacteriota bacterium]
MAKNNTVILLIEDNPDHVLLIKEALTANNIINEIRVVEDGEQALDYLFRRGQYADPRMSPRPTLIILDIKLPKIDGQEVLKTIKSDPGLKHIPVIVLTTTTQEEEIVKSFKNGANSYVTKPIDPQEFFNKIKNLKVYWLITNSVPRSD